MLNNLFKKFSSFIKIIITFTLLAILSARSIAGTVTFTHNRISELTIPVFHAGNTYMPAADTEKIYSVGGIVQIYFHDRNEAESPYYLPIYFHKGIYWLAGTHNQQYSINILKAGNTLPYSTVVSIDGLNIATGEFATNHQYGYVLPLDNYSEFKKFELTNSYTSHENQPQVLKFNIPAMTDIPEKLHKKTFENSHGRGHIWLSFFKEETVSYTLEKMNFSSNEAKNNYKYRAIGNITKKLPLLETKDFSRASVIPFLAVTLRYDSFENLVRRGVLTSTKLHLLKPPKILNLRK